LTSYHHEQQQTLAMSTCIELNHAAELTRVVTVLQAWPSTVPQCVGYIDDECTQP